MNSPESDLPQIPPERVARWTDTTPLRLNPTISDPAMWIEWLRVSKRNLLVAVGAGAIYGAFFAVPSIGVGLIGLIAFLGAHQAAKQGAKVIRSWRLRSVRGADASVDELGVPGFQVFVQIVTDHVVTGEDCGVLWFEDGHLKFAGARTSFVITRGDLLSRNWLRDNKGPIKGLTHDLGLWLISPNGGSRVFLAIGLADPKESFANNSRLSVELSAFLGRSRPGDGQFPPLAMGPGAIPPSKVLLKLFGQTSLAILQGVILVVIGQRWFGWINCFIFGAVSEVGVIGYARAFISTWRRWRKEKRR